VEEPEPQTPEERLQDAKARVEYNSMMKEQRNEGIKLGILHPKDMKKE